MTAPLDRRLEMLAELSADRAQLVSLDVLALQAAVDGLQGLAAAWGLVDAVGQDCIQAIIAAPFRLPQVEEAA